MTNLEQFHDRLTLPMTIRRIKQTKQIEDFIYFEDEMNNIWRVYLGGDHYPSIQMIKHG